VIFESQYPHIFLSPQKSHITYRDFILMSFQTPSSKASITIDDLGRLDGFHYANGVEQFCGIPYGTLSKRWTRSTLCTSWKNDYHDGTQL